jgi:teichuronic acid biosynthesis glycosyltransferase TuaG
MTLVSIITPTYNSQDTILDTYNSILSQDLKDWEWLVTDDASSDGTVRILNKISSKDQRVKVFINESNSGAAVSRNKSLSHVTGNFIAFIDSDDSWEPRKLSKQISFMQSNKSNFSFTTYSIVDADGHSTGKSVDRKELKPLSYADMLTKKATLGCSTVMLRTDTFRDQLFMPLLRTGQDYAFWLKLLKIYNEKASHLPISLTNYKILPNSISRNKFKKCLRQWEIYRKVEKLSFIYSFYCFIHYAFKATFRK